MIARYVPTFTRARRLRYEARQRAALDAASRNAIRRLALRLVHGSNVQQLARFLQRAIQPLIPARIARLTILGEQGLLRQDQSLLTGVAGVSPDKTLSNCREALLTAA